MPKRIYIFIFAPFVALLLLFGFGRVTLASSAPESSQNGLGSSLFRQAPPADEVQKEPGKQTAQTTCAVTTRIMPLGDSITKGSSSGVDDPALQISYRKDLWDLLAANGYNVNFVGSLINGENYTGFDPDHEGHGGWTDAQVARNIYGTDGENWLTQNPADVILLHIGTNALSSNERDVENILNRIDQFETDSGTHVTVILARIINRVPYSLTTTEFNDNVEAMALDRIASGDDIVLVDMEDGAGLIYDYYNASPPGDMYDSKHPYATGYTKMAAVWYAALSGILNHCNQAPVVDPIANQTDAEGDSVSLGVVASDPDEDVLAYSASGLPSGLSINSSSGLINGVISYEAAASSPYQVTVTVTDDGTPSISSQVQFSWTVTNTNRPPQVTNPGDQSDATGEFVSLEILATDPDSNSLTYSASGLPANLDIRASSGLIEGTLAVDAYTGSPYNVTVTVEDNGIPSLSDAVNFAWTVTQVNQSPVLVNPGAQENAEGDSVSLQIAASDPDTGDTLTYSASGLPQGLSINSSSGLIQGIVGYNAAGSSPSTVVLTVSDDGSPSLEDTATFIWTINNTNRAPQVTAPGNQSGAEGDTVSLLIQASDPDGDTLTYSASGLPQGLNIDSSSGLIQGNVGYDAAANSPYTIVISVSDDGSPSLEGTATFTWTINNTNRAPQITNPGNQFSGEGDPVSLPIQASDPDGDGLSFGATGLPPGLEINPASGLISGAISFTATDSNPYTVVVTVSDDYSPSASSQVTFQWSVTDTNRSPQITDPGDQTGTVGEAVSLQIQASDPDADALAYSASGLPDNLVINPDSGSIEGTLAMDAYLGSPYTVTVTVEDNGVPSLRDTVNFEWVVSAGNHPPVLANPGAQESAEGERVSLQITASDPDAGDTLTYSASGLPEGLAIGAATGWISGTLSYDTSANSPYTVTLSVTDDGLVQFTDVVTFTWMVANTNRPPEVANPGSRFNLPGDHIFLQIEASDPDGDVLTYAASGLPETLSIDPDTGLISGTVTTGSPGNNAVEVAVSDGHDTVTIKFAWGIRYIQWFFPMMRNG